jgi:hypothetical protein
MSTPIYKPSKLELEHLYIGQNMTRKALAEYFGMTNGSLKKILYNYRIIKPNSKFRRNVERGNKLGIKQMPNKKEIQCFYHDEHMSISDLAEYYGVSDPLIMKWLKIYGLTKTRKEIYLSTINHGGGRYQLKDYKFPSGNIVKVQGYEPFALALLTEIYKFKEEEIVVDNKLIPTIYYENHYHLPDIFIPPKNLIIEVKSTWTFKKNEKECFLKKDAAINAGYNYEIWIFDQKQNLIIS